MAWIKNIDKCKIPACNCGTWYEHWNRKSGQWLICCAESSCTRPISRGALVQGADNEDGKWYVVPLCHHHNDRFDFLDIGEAKLVLVEGNGVCRETIENLN
jgi:hypothetical protein